MKCWKCGQDNTDGTRYCIHCGADQSRVAPVSEVGRAMRSLYDRYGAKEVLSNSAYLVNGLSDLTLDSKKLRNQLKMGLDAGLGRAYLQQLNIGKPDSAFDSRVRSLLTDEAGLNEKTASEISGYFDEMIGWRATVQQSVPTPNLIQQSISKEINRNATVNIPKQEINRNQPIFTSNQEIDRSKQPEINRAESGNTTGKFKYNNKLYNYEIAFYGCLVAVLVLGVLVNRDHDPANYLDFVVNGLLIIPLIMSFLISQDNLRNVWKKDRLLINFVLVFFIAIMAGDIVNRRELLVKISNGTYSDSMSKSYEWQQHCLIGDIIFLIPAIALEIQMIRHRILEKKLTERAYYDSFSKES